MHSWDLVRGTGADLAARRLARRDRAGRDAAGADRREPRGRLRVRGRRCRPTRRRTSGWPRSRVGTRGLTVVGRPPVWCRRARRGQTLPVDYRRRGGRRQSHRSPSSTAIAAATPRPMIHEMSRSAGGGEVVRQLLRRRAVEVGDQVDGEAERVSDVRRRPRPTERRHVLVSSTVGCGDHELGGARGRRASCASSTCSRSSSQPSGRTIGRPRGCRPGTGAPARSPAVGVQGVRRRVGGRPRARGGGRRGRSAPAPTARTSE